MLRHSQLYANPLSLLITAMAKSKNHTNHNQNAKAHANGIKKPQRHRYSSQKG